MAHCERGMMLKSSSSRVVWEDFQGALRTHAAPHGNLKTGETPIARLWWWKALLERTRRASGLPDQ